MKAFCVAMLLAISALTMHAQVQPHPPGAGQITGVSGNGSTLATVSGPVTAGDCAKWDANGNAADAGSPCGSGGGVAGLGANTYSGVQSAPGFSATGTTQTILNLTQGSAASAPPANTIQRGAPLSVPNSYTLYDPSAPPPDASGDIEVTPQGGGTSTWMAPPAMVLIARQTLASATGTVTFSGIPQTFTNLVMVHSGSTTGGASLWAVVNINGDSTAGDYFVAYSSITFGGAATTSGSFSNAGLFLPVNAATTTFYGYTGTTGVNATSQGTAGGSLIGEASVSDIWAGAGAITSMVITTNNSDTFKAGSTFALYGVK